MDTMDSEILLLFREEAAALLEHMEEILEECRQSHRIVRENVDEMFRAMHTLKGNSELAEQADMARISHRSEDILAVLRDGDPPSPEKADSLTDLLLRAVNLLNVRLKGPVDGASPAFSREFSELEQELCRGLSLSSGSKNSVSTPPVPLLPIPSSSGSAGCSSASVRVILEEDCGMENIRAFLILSQLEGICRVIDSIPSHLETDEKTCRTISQNGFLFSFEPSSALSSVMEAISQNVYVKSCEIFPAENQENLQKDISVRVSQEKLNRAEKLSEQLLSLESLLTENDCAEERTEIFCRLCFLTGELRQDIHALSMSSFSGIFRKAERIVRSMEQSLRKDTVFLASGDAQIDRNIIDSLFGPIMHILRNAMDHGMEPPEERVQKGKPRQGRITLSVRRDPRELVIQIGDDGRGLDREKILEKAKNSGLMTKPESACTEKEIFGLILLPGFSTKEEITGYSGRGVGMDAANQAVRALGGAISIESAAGLGSRFTITVPLAQS